MAYLEIILPLPLPGSFTYQYSPENHPEPKIGCRVIVQFGKQKIYTGIIVDVHNDTPTQYQPKEIIEIVDEEPVITRQQLQFFQWMAKYYMCTMGEVINAALPAGLKISSESLISINIEIDLEEGEWTSKEQMILTHLADEDLTVDAMAKLLEVKSPYSYIKKLKDKNAVQVFERIKDKYTPKTEAYVRLQNEFSNEEALDILVKELSGKTKQIEVIEAYLRQVDILSSPELNDIGIPKKQLLREEISPSSLKTLHKNGVIEVYDKEISRIPDGALKNSEINLNDAQKKATQEILQQFDSQDTVLLHGVTGSGKTEVFISIIQQVLESGGQVLYMLPEIALTTQIISRLSRVFGDQFGIYHSKYSDAERVEVWNKVLDETYQFVVGVRSSIFLPFKNLALVIVDEEHEPSFKQYDPAPRYHARDAAIYQSALFGSKTLLGTATPSLESYHNALAGKYGLVELTERYNQGGLPKIKLTDLRQARKKRQVKGNFSNELLEQISEALENQKQVILFQNRRGYAPYVTCNNCGYIPKCPHCDVSLTYHIHQNFLICHYCGHKSEMITTCMQCQSNEIHTMSYGTEKIEEELEILIPTARIKRMDLDSTRSKYSYQRIIDDFESGEIDVLIGTQMVSKGLDFDDVALVGIFDADRMIHFPDFRSHERAYQLMHQVSGRAGRRKDQGEVIIQTNDPLQPLFNYLKVQDYIGFYRSEILERQTYKYPPYYRLINIVIKDKDKQVANDAAQHFAATIRKQLGNGRVIGPVEPLIGKIRNLYLFEILIKIEKQGINLAALKEFLLNSRNMLINQRWYKSVKVVFDVDPI